MSNAISEFNFICERIKSGKIMTASTNIRSLLRCIAHYGELRLAAESCRRNFDYEKNYAKALKNMGAYLTFRMPESDKKTVALGLSLFAEFDLGRKSLMDFVTDYFPAKNRSDAYEQFVTEVVAPFQAAFLAVAEGRDSNEFEVQEGETETTLISEGLEEQANYIIMKIADTVREVSLEEDDREDCQTVLKGFAYAVETRDPMLLRVTWVGLKDTMKYHRLAAKDMKQLEDILKQYIAL